MCLVSYGDIKRTSNGPPFIVPQNYIDSWEPRSCQHLCIYMCDCTIRNTEILWFLTKQGFHVQEHQMFRFLRYAFKSKKLKQKLKCNFRNSTSCQDYQHYPLLWMDSNVVPFLTLLDSALVQVEAGNRALKAVFSSKLAAKGKSLAELLQPHSIGKQQSTFLLHSSVLHFLFLYESWIKMPSSQWLTATLLLRFYR